MPARTRLARAQTALLPNHHCVLDRALAGNKQGNACTKGSLFVSRWSTLWIDGVGSKRDDQITTLQVCVCDLILGPALAVSQTSMYLPCRAVFAACVALIAVGILGSLSMQTARAQAWPLPKGDAYVKLSLQDSRAAKQYRFDGEVKPYADNVDGDAFFDRSLYLYAEYGLTNDLTLVTLVPYKRLRVLDAAFEYETEGIGSLILGLRIGLKERLGIRPDSRHALATTISATIPTGYTRNFTPAIGPGQLDLQGTLSYGISMYPFPGYAQAWLGYRYRSQFYGFSTTIPCQEGRDINCIRGTEPKYDDEVLFSGEAGVSLGRWALLQVLGYGVWSNNPPTPGTSFTPRNPIPTRQRFIKTGFGVTIYPIVGLGFSIQYYVTPYGRNTVKSTDIFFGIEYKIEQRN